MKLLMCSSTPSPSSSYILPSAYQPPSIPDDHADARLTDWASKSFSTDGYVM